MKNLLTRKAFKFSKNSNCHMILLFDSKGFKLHHASIVHALLPFLEVIAHNVKS